MNRNGQLWKSKKHGEVVVLLYVDHYDNVGDAKWASLVIEGGQLHSAGELITYSEMWFSDSRFSWEMQRLA